MFYKVLIKEEIQDSWFGCILCISSFGFFKFICWRSVSTGKKVMI